MSTSSESRVGAGSRNWIEAVLGPTGEGLPRERLRLASKGQRAALFIYLVVMLVGITIGIIATASDSGDAQPTSERRLAWLALLAGTLGGAVHALTSLGQHNAKGQLFVNWWMFYLSRPLIGGAVAIILLFLFAAGIVGDGNTTMSTYRTLAWSALAGLFSFRLLEKFRDLLNALLPTSGNENAATRSEAGTAALASQDPGDNPDVVPEPDRPPDPEEKP